MKPVRRLLAAGLLASVPVWVACSNPTDSTVVGLTGRWIGDITDRGSDCLANLSITEDNNGTVTGTADLQAPCPLVTLTVTGTNNTGGVANSVVLTFVGAPADTLLFDGNFDGINTMIGALSHSHGTNLDTIFTRSFPP